MGGDSWIMANETVSQIGSALSLLKKIDKTNPEVAQAVEIIARAFQALYLQVNPPITPAQNRASGTVSSNVADVTNFQVTLAPTNVQFSWTRTSNALSYELRQGTDWATASQLLITSSSNANFDPTILNLVYGSYTFLIKAIDDEGFYSTTPASVTFTITQIGVVNLTGTAIQNNALLDWETPSSIFKIDYYLVYRDGLLIGRATGTFTVNSVVIAGLYSYSIRSVDIVGNQSLPSSEIELSLLEPENYLLYDTLYATYAGTYSDAINHNYLGNNGVIGPKEIETWDDHFVNNSWLTPQDQIDAGFPIYIQPAAASGYYEEIFDLGAVIDNFTVTGLWTLVTFAGVVTILTEVSISTDNITYSTPVAGPSAYYATGRYVKFRWEFDPLDATSIGFIFNLGIKINVQYTLDSGNTACLSTDVGGTEIFYNKSFNEVDSVTATAVNTSAAIVVTDNIDGVSFLCLVFDKNGTRISATVDWKARGIV